MEELLFIYLYIHLSLSWCLSIPKMCLYCTCTKLSLSLSQNSYLAAQIRYYTLMKQTWHQTTPYILLKRKAKMIVLHTSLLNHYFVILHWGKKEVCTRATFLNIHNFR